MLTEDGDEQKQAVALKVKSCIELRGSEQNQINQIMMMMVYHKKPLLNHYLLKLRRMRTS